MTRRTPPLNVQLQDVDAERVRRNHEARLGELAARPAADLHVIADVTLADATTTAVSHPLGRRPKLVIVSPPRGASSTGRIEEVRDGTVDRTRQIALKATGWGATITIDVGVL